MEDENYQKQVRDCLTKELLFHRYLYYVVGEPVITDSTYDLIEKEAKSLGIDIFMDKTGMVGYDKNNAYHDEIVKVLTRLKADPYLIQAWCWRSLWPEQWEWHKKRANEYAKI